VPLNTQGSIVHLLAGNLTENVSRRLPLLLNSCSPPRSIAIYECPFSLAAIKRHACKAWERQIHYGFQALSFLSRGDTDEQLSRGNCLSGLKRSASRRRSCPTGEVKGGKSQTHGRRIARPAQPSTASAISLICFHHKELMTMRHAMKYCVNHLKTFPDADNRSAFHESLGIYYRACLLLIMRH
jgi:hypothetical protein